MNEVVLPNELIATSGARSAPLHCVLVHGTHARDADWVQPTSLLHQAVADLESEGVCTYKYLWSGSNTHSARVDAAETLGKSLSVLAANHPAARILLVGHSHGGNVAMRAVRDVPAQQRAGVVCLATPFFHVRPRELLVLRWFYAGLILSAIGVVTALAGGLSVLFVRLMPWLFSWINRLQHSFMSDAFLSYGFAAEYVVRTLLWFVIPVAYALYVHDLSMPQEQVRSLERWNRLKPQDARTLSIWFGPDEAFLGLRSLRRIGEVGHKAIGLFSKVLLPLLTVGAAILVCWYGWVHTPKTFVAGDIEPFWRGPATAATAGAAMAIVPTLLWLVTAIAGALPRFLTGRLPLGDHLWLDIRTERTPQIAWGTIEGRPLRLSDAGFWPSLMAWLPVASGNLTHSRPYVDSRTFDLIRGWYRRGRLEWSRDLI